MNKLASAVRLIAPTLALVISLGFATVAAAQQAQPAATPGAAAPSAATPAPTAAPTVKGNIKGTVTNATKNGGSVAGLDINLYVYQGQTQSTKLTTKAGQDGKFSFEGVNAGPDYTYLVHAQYQGADYASDPLTFPTGTTDVTGDLEVYDATPSDEAVKVSARHYLLDVEPDGLYISEIAIISNGGDKTYVGSKEIHQGVKETLRFTLPENAQKVEYGGGMMGTRVFQENGDLVDTWPLYPGDSQRIFRYQLSLSGDTASFVSKLSGAVTKVNVLIPDNGIGITVSNLPNKTTQDIQGEKYLLLSGDNLAAGTQLEFKLDQVTKAQAAAKAAAAAAQQGQQGQPGAQGQQGLGSLLPMLAGSGIIVIVAIASVVTMLVRRRRGGARKTARDGAAADDDGADEAADARDLSEAELEAEEEILDAQKKELVAAIARLDDDFEAQRVSAEEYGRLRAEKKRKLVEVVDRQKSLAAARGDQ